MWYDIIVFVYIYINIWQQSDGFQDLSRLNAPALCRGFFTVLNPMFYTDQLLVREWRQGLYEKSFFESQGNG